MSFAITSGSPSPSALPSPEASKGTDKKDEKGTPLDRCDPQALFYATDSIGCKILLDEKDIIKALEQYTNEELVAILCFAALNEDLLDLAKDGIGHSKFFTTFDKNIGSIAGLADYEFAWLTDACNTACKEPRNKAAIFFEAIQKFNKEWLGFLADCPKYRDMIAGQYKICRDVRSIATVIDILIKRILITRNSGTPFRDFFYRLCNVEAPPALTKPHNWPFILSHKMPLRNSIILSKTPLD